MLVDALSEILKFFHDHNETATEDWRIRLRIGIHMGDVIRRREDVFGDTVNVASRIEQLADPEGICISGQVFEQINNELEIPFVRLEDVELKNVKKPVAVYKILLPWEKWLQTSHDKIKLSKNRIAILPFGKVSSDSESEFFADGITEEPIASPHQRRRIFRRARRNLSRNRRAEIINSCHSQVARPSSINSPRWRVRRNRLSAAVRAPASPQSARRRAASI